MTTAGAMSRLERLDDWLRLAEGEIASFHGFAHPTRRVIAPLADGGLWYGRCRFSIFRRRGRRATER
jgi:hypothetical protein